MIRMKPKKGSPVLKIEHIDIRVIADNNDDCDRIMTYVENQFFGYEIEQVIEGFRND
jgi:hypothetical protein